MLIQKVSQFGFRTDKLHFGVQYFHSSLNFCLLLIIEEKLAHNFNVGGETVFLQRTRRFSLLFSFAHVVQLMCLSIFFSSQKVYSAAQNKLNREVIDKFKGGLLLA